MDRRAFLAGLCGASASGLAGCAVGAPGTTAADDSRRNGTVSDPDAPLGSFGFPETICSEPAQEDPGIYAITEPAFAADWRDREIDERYRSGSPGGLGADQTVIGLETTETARAYPISVLWVHEVVNDSIGGVPVLVTYCSLCRSGMVARRRVDGERTTFRVSGLLWRAPGVREGASEAEGRVFGARRTGGEELSVRSSGNVVIVDDATGSYWSQILARAICGPKEGTTLSQFPATVTTWEDWRTTHPETTVLLPAPYSGTTNPER